MTRMVNCVHLGREAEGLAMQTYPGALGKRILTMYLRKRGASGYVNKPC